MIKANKKHKLANLLPEQREQTQKLVLLGTALGETSQSNAVAAAPKKALPSFQPTEHVTDRVHPKPPARSKLLRSQNAGRDR